MNSPLSSPPMDAVSSLEGAGLSVPPALGDVLKRMRQQSDFPAMSESIMRVQALAGSETESIQGLTNEILKDVALTQKLLRLVNSAENAHTGGGISTVSRAVSLVGFGGIRNLALSLLLLEHMQDKAHAEQLRTEFLRAQLAATLADDACHAGGALAWGDHEQAFIGALFQHLGRMLAGFYLPKEAQLVREAVAAGSTESAAAHKWLKLDYEQLGLGVVRAWGLPGSIQRLMSRPAAKPPSRMSGDTAERLRWLVTWANDAADCVLAQPAEALPAALDRLARQYAPSLGLDPIRMVADVQAAREKLAGTAQVMGVSVTPGSPGERLLVTSGATEPAATDSGPCAEADNNAGLTLLALAAPGEMPALTPPADTAVSAPPHATPDTQTNELLALGIQDVTQALVDGLATADVLRMVLETLWRALGVRRVVLCVRDASGQQLVGRTGFGEAGIEVARRFRVPLDHPHDLFALVCRKGLDTLISDTAAPNVAQRLPAWFLEQVKAPTFLLLPLQFKGTTLGLIYADADRAQALNLSESQLALLKTLRNQAVMAFRQPRA